MSDRNEYSISISRSRRNKRLRLRVRNDRSVAVSAPLGTPKILVSRFIADHETWIKQQLARQTESLALVDGFQLTPDHVLVLHDGQSNSIQIQPHSLTVETKLRGYELFQLLRPSLKKVLRLAAEKHLTPRVAVHARNCRLAEPAIRFQYATSRLGSYQNRDHRIMLNTQLVRFDERYWDYVILHELTHITQPHHQAAFWSLFTEYLPEAKALAKETRQLNLWP